jgi:hypothetical protein
MAINGQLLSELGRAEDVLATSSKPIVRLGIRVALLALFVARNSNGQGLRILNSGRSLSGLPKSRTMAQLPILGLSPIGALSH